MSKLQCLLLFKIICMHFEMRGNQCKCIYKSADKIVAKPKTVKYSVRQTMQLKQWVQSSRQVSPRLRYCRHASGNRILSGAFARSKATWMTEDCERCFVFSKHKKRCCRLNFSTLKTFGRVLECLRYWFCAFWVY